MTPGNHKPQHPNSERPFKTACKTLTQINQERHEIIKSLFVVFSHC